MSWAASAPWLPPLLVLIVSALAVALARGPAGLTAVRQRRVVGITVLGALAVAATSWQAWSASERIARLVEQNHSAALAKQVGALESELSKLKRGTKRRTIGADASAKLADYLRRFGAHKVVVSCVPNDVEAYQYATEIVNLLKLASWDASGPEPTAIFGDIRAMGVNVYNAGKGSDTVKILLDGFAKFDIPYQSRVPPSETLPDDETVELFIGAKPMQPTMTETAPTPE